MVTENGVDRTLHRRYNDFAELHRSLVRACGLEATRGLELPGKRVFKRKKFEAAFLEVWPRSRKMHAGDREKMLA